MTVEHDPLATFHHVSTNGHRDETDDPAYIAALMADASRLEQLAPLVDQHRPSRDKTLDTLTLDELLDSEDPPYDWLVPNLIERCDRFILTGIEGKGKSTLLRQMGVQLAAGIHPFGGDPFDPLRVLMVDCENSQRQVRRQVGRLRSAAGRGDQIRFKFRPDGVRLNIVEDVAWLENLITNTEPEVVIMGPVYKMASGDPRDETAARAVSDVLDSLRTTHNFALMLEAHTPYAEGSRSKRPERPYGASLWSRWPEFGIFIDPDGKLKHWRGQREERAWPIKLRRGDTWPWELDEAAPAPAAWVGPTQCMSAVYDLLCATSPTEHSVNSLVSTLKSLGHGFHKSTVSDAAERLSIDGKVAVRSGPNRSRLFRNETGIRLPLAPSEEEF